MKFLMGVDEGTTGCKTILFNENGQQIAATSKEGLLAWEQFPPEDSDIIMSVILPKCHLV